MAKKWFYRFQSGNFDARDALCRSRPVTTKADENIAKADKDRCASSHYPRNFLQTIINHSREAGYARKLDA